MLNTGKKFKGPDFVQKHIFNKHAEKVDEVKKEVKYFNNYLKDPRRPQLPEHPNNKPGNRMSSDALLIILIFQTNVNVDQEGLIMKILSP